MADLEKLAVSLGENFLKSLAQRGKYANGNERLMFLGNAPPITLRALKKHLHDYFRRRNEKVTIYLEEDFYSINVRALLH